MTGTESTATRDPTEPPPGFQAEASQAAASATVSTGRLAYWSVRRELWEHRWIYIVPLIVAAVFLLGFVTGGACVPLRFPLNSLL